MYYLTFMEQGFWELMTGCVPLIVPVIAIILLFRIIGSFIVGKNRV